MSTRALQIECLLTPIIDYRNGSVASGFTVEFYAAGTSTPKTVWTEKEKAAPFTTATLSSDGTVHLYGDGIYKILIKDLDGVVVYEWDDIKIQSQTFTLVNKSGTYTVTSDDDMVIVDAVAGDVTINLSTVVDFTHPVVIKRVVGVNDVIIDPFGAEQIDGAATITLGPVDDSATLYPNVAGVSWSRANRFEGLTASIGELNLLDGITAIKDEDDMASNSDTSLVTQQSIKAYVDSGVITMTNKTHTLPKINEDVALTATSTNINAVAIPANTGKNAHTHTLGGGATDVTATAAQVNTACGSSTARNEHVHSNITITAGTGLSGGGTLAASRTITHPAHTGDVTGATTLTIASAAVNTTKLKTVANTTGASGSLMALSSVLIEMQDYCFAPNIYTWSGAAMRLGGHTTNATDTVARFRIHNSDTADATYAVRWRYVTATDEPFVYAIRDLSTGEILHLWACDDPPDKYWKLTEKPADFVPPLILSPGLANVEEIVLFKTNRDFVIELGAKANRDKTLPYQELSAYDYDAKAKVFKSKNLLEI
jgi:hypothetical protein